MKSNQEKIKIFLSSSAFGVVGASTNREKFGNKVLRCYLQNNKKAYPINPRATTIEGVQCLKTISELPENVESISIITPPKITEQAVKEAIKKGVKNIWMQPGAESSHAISECKKHNINVIAGGPCILIELGYSDNF